MIEALASMGPLGILCAAQFIAIGALYREWMKERQARIDDAKRLNDVGTKLLEAAANRAAARITMPEEE
jgi:hypothetical protein